MCFSKWNYFLYWNSFSNCKLWNIQICIRHWIIMSFLLKRVFYYLRKWIEYLSTNLSIKWSRNKRIFWYLVTKYIFYWVKKMFYSTWQFLNQLFFFWLKISLIQLVFSYFSQLKLLLEKWSFRCNFFCINNFQRYQIWKCFIIIRL